MTDYQQTNDAIPLPPVDAKVSTTVCAYCIVGCGYKVYTWPLGKEGKPQAKENALGVDFPGEQFGPWISPNQHAIVQLDGQDQHVAVLPDFDATVVNPNGNHSIRGGVLAKKCYHPSAPTKDRLLYPQIRINGKLQRVSWDLALDVMAAISQHVLKKYGESAWAMKTYSYEFFENTYAITKLAFEAIQTPAYAVHDKPSMGNDTAGLDDAGIKTFSASYQDWSEAEVLFISGTDPYESKTVLFTEWMMNQDNKIIMVLPRRTAGVAYAEKNGGLFLQINPGTDTLLHLAMNRIILENNWEDKEFISKWIADEWEIDSGFGRGTRNTPWQWRTTWGSIGALSFEKYKDWLLNYAPAELESAAKITGIPPEKIQQAAQMISGGGGKRPRTSFGFEKGNYWSNNYTNTTSFAALALLCGAGNRPGRVVSRLGGHQRGWIGAASYPRTKSPEKLPGRRRLELDLDRWVTAGQVRFAWVIGTTWLGAMTASQELLKRFRQQTTENPHQVSSRNREEIIQTLIDRVDSGGMVLVDSDIYPVEPLNTELSDIVLPAAQWGEHDGARCNGERRLRLYSQFCDAPGEAKPDWWAISQFAQKMGFKGFDWKDANTVFEEAARFSRGNILDYYPLVWKAKQEGVKGHEALRELGTTGIQTPIRLEENELVGTRRLHDPELNLGTPQGPTSHPKWLTHFNTHSGKALLIQSPWELFVDYYERISPQRDQGEFWFTVGRINETWQSGFDTLREKYLTDRWPDAFVEIHPDDAGPLGIESGDYLRLWSDDILVQQSGFQHIEPKSFSFTQLMKEGHIRVGSGEMKAVAILTTAVKPGLLFGMFLYGKRMGNSLVHRVPDPITHSYRYKLGKANIEKQGASPFKDDFQKMSFKQRDYSGA
ncbi:arsenate reductase (azurin) large subunit [Gimesia sp.]|uniref:arsenate reductase (azurin) large subunit n=1 Tax=Gimesia sp. TaxID=2024833 RepID=UPI003A8FA5F0